MELCFFVYQAGVPDPPDMKESLLEQKKKERAFLEQLIDGSKLENYQIEVPIKAELRKYQQVSKPGSKFIKLRLETNLKSQASDWLK
jgi:hypothetical protein